MPSDLPNNIGYVLREVVSPPRHMAVRPDEDQPAFIKGQYLGVVRCARPHWDTFLLKCLGEDLGLWRSIAGMEDYESVT